MKIAVSESTPEEMAQLAHIYLSGRRKAFHWIESDQFRLEDFFDHSAGELVLVARSDAGNALGFISCWQPEDFIHMLYVAEAWRGRGVGSALLKALPQWSIRPYRLKCLVNNGHAHTFYRRRGFSISGCGVSPEGLYDEMTIFPLPSKLETERLVLRRWTAEDAPQFVDMHAHPEVMAWLWHRPRDLADAQNYITTLEQHFENERFGLWAVERRGDGRLIGMSGLRRVLWDGHPMTPCVEMVWRQARDVWGQGYATEAASAALRDGFDRAALNEVFAWTAATNLRSQGVMRRIGMERREALDFEQPGLAENHPHRRHVVFGMKSASLDE